MVRHRWVILAAWLLLAIIARSTSPAFRDVAADGDFDYLPPQTESVVGGELIQSAFPGVRARSEMVVIVARERGEWGWGDDAVANDLSRRLHLRTATALMRRLLESPTPGAATTPPAIDGDDPRVQRITAELDQAVAADEAYYQAIEPEIDGSTESRIDFPRLATIYQVRSRWRRRTGDTAGAADDAEAARVFYPPLGFDSVAGFGLPPGLEPPPGLDAPPGLEPPPTPEPKVTAEPMVGQGEIKVDGGGDSATRVPATPVPANFVPATASATGRSDSADAGWNAVLDLVAWDDPVIGGELRSPSSRLMILKLASELAATSNIKTLTAVEALVDRVRATSMGFAPPGLRIGITGSAAIGGETLIAARDAIRYTEAITVAMILLILTLVYRSPLLVAVPMASIGVAVMVAMGLVTTLAGPDVGWLRLFTTSRIFIVVILFGAGTDFCLFLIARLREQAFDSPWPVAIRDSITGVGGALIGSAMTTVVGLAMLGLADFGKFRSTGPVVALCLVIGLAVCLTFTPALLAVLGPAAFWPTSIRHSGSRRNGSAFWKGIAMTLTHRPATWLIGGLLILGAAACYGWRHQDDVTYDLASELNATAVSRQGLSLLRGQYDLGRITPVTVIVQTERPEALDSLKTRVRDLTRRMYDVGGVTSVRNADDPLGKYPPDREMGLLQTDAMKRRLLRQHRTAQNTYFSETSPYDKTLFRIDVAIDRDPFDAEAGAVVDGLREFLTGETKPGGVIAGGRYAVTGAAASLTDLRRVIASDNRRIRIAVTLGVLAVLILVLRRVGLSLYLVMTVLISYYATLGLTVAFFRWSYGNSYVGLDWKLPVFLFVILVAIGQDYNVYLTTRIMEEHRRRPIDAALRRAVARTGGIITACGLVMAATFFSMTASAWLPPLLSAFGFDPGGGRTLRGIVELGFALGLGMIVDTFYVRTILVPSWVAVVGRLTQR